MTDKNNDYRARKPIHIKLSDLSEKQKFLLVESKNFCMLPWLHMHAFPDGRVYPCCMGEYHHDLGNLRSHTMEQVWNQDNYKMLRKNMMEDKPSAHCTKCYEREEHGFFSLRNDANRNYGHHIADIDKTHSDGNHPEFVLKYWDIRFSNLCNLRCRTCGPLFSSNWYNDHIKLYGTKPEINGRKSNSVEYAGRFEMDVWEQMQPHIPYLEQVYFAGGEPLIMKEHYLLLEKLIELGKTDVRLIYNTNFTELAYKGQHVFDLWRHFKSVGVGASLDASGQRAEIMRKGTDWKQIVANREKMIAEIPHVDFYIAATLSSMNVLHILDFHREWTELGLISAKDFDLNICQSPGWYRVDILPKQVKEEIIVPAYQRHLEWLRPLDQLERASNGFASAINYMLATDREKLIARFIEETKKLDTVRNENFWDVFTELEFLKSHVAT